MKKRSKNLVKHSSRVVALCLLLGAVALAVAIYDLPASAEPSDPPVHREPVLLTPGMATKIALSDRDDIAERELEVAPEQEVELISDSGRSTGQRLVESTSIQQGIYGQVTYQGTPISGVGLRLRFFDGNDWSTSATTTTDSDGQYDFVGAPSLSPGQKYRVVYNNNGMGDSYLWWWIGPSITSYAAGSTVHGGDFDIANVSLLEPPATATRTLPVTFRWARRELSGYTYKLWILDRDVGFYWNSGDLGDTDSYTLESLAPGMEYGHPYRWVVWIYHGSDSFGESYYYRSITLAEPEEESRVFLPLVSKSRP